MRKLTTLPADRARVFSDVLEAEGIEHEVQDGGEVWVLRDSDLDDAGTLLQAWREDPTAERFTRAAAIAEAARKRLADEEARRRRAQQRLDRAERPITWGPVTVGVLAASGALTLLGIPSLDAIGDSLVSLPAAERLDWAFLDSLPILRGPDGPYVPYLWDVRQGQVWRLITPIFVHVGGLFHLFFNGYWFWDFGRQIESRRGSLYLLALILGLGIVSNLAQYTVGWWMIDLGVALSGQAPSFAVGPIYLGGPSFGGLSGVLYGLFGFIWAKSAVDKFSGLGVSSSTVGVLVVWLLVCFTGMVGPVANIAHLGGLVAGVLWGGVSHRIRRPW